MSNLIVARNALQAEVAYVRSGLAYYTARLAALEQSLAVLNSLGEEHIIVEAESTEISARKVPSAKAAKKKRRAAKAARAKTAQPAKTRTALPFTGGDFWPGLLNDQPQSTAEILHAAVARIGFALSPTLRKQLVGRMTFALNNLVKQKKILDSGAGRERRFFKK